MLGYIRNNPGAALGVALTALAVVLIVLFMPHGSTNVGPAAPASAMPSSSASVSAIAKPTGAGVPAPPAKAGPQAGADPFTDAVLAFEATKHMEDPAAKNAALAKVATPEYLATHKLVENGASSQVVVKIFPTPQSEVDISDEYQNPSGTFRTVSTFVTGEKRDANGVLLGVINDPLDVTTWVLTPQNEWKIVRDGK